MGPMSLMCFLHNKVSYNIPLWIHYWKYSTHPGCHHRLATQRYHPVFCLDTPTGPWAAVPVLQRHPAFCNQCNSPDLLFTMTASVIKMFIERIPLNWEMLCCFLVPQGVHEGFELSACRWYQSSGNSARVPVLVLLSYVRIRASGWVSWQLQLTFNALSRPPAHWMGRHFRRSLLAKEDY